MTTQNAHKTDKCLLRSLSFKTTLPDSVVSPFVLWVWNLNFKNTQRWPVSRGLTHRDQTPRGQMEESGACLTVEVKNKNGSWRKGMVQQADQCVVPCQRVYTRSHILILIKVAWRGARVWSQQGEFAHFKSCLHGAGKLPGKLAEQQALHGPCHNDFLSFLWLFPVSHKSISILLFCKYTFFSLTRVCTREHTHPHTHVKYHWLNSILVTVTFIVWVFYSFC